MLMCATTQNYLEGNENTSFPYCSNQNGDEASRKQGLNSIAGETILVAIGLSLNSMFRKPIILLSESMCSLLAAWNEN